MAPIGWLLEGRAVELKSSQIAKTEEKEWAIGELTA
jgi:hypothetical protein